MASTTATRPDPRARARVSRRPLHVRMTNARAALGWPLLFVGFWLCISIFALLYPDTVGSQNAHLNEILVGMVVIFNALARLLRPRTGVVSDLLVIAAGLWTIAAPFAVQYRSDAGQAPTNDIVCGSVLFFLGIVSLLMYRTSRLDAHAREHAR